MVDSLEGVELGAALVEGLSWFAERVQHVLDVFINVAREVDHCILALAEDLENSILTVDDLADLRQRRTCERWLLEPSSSLSRLCRGDGMAQELGAGVSVPPRSVREEGVVPAHVDQREPLATTVPRGGTQHRFERSLELEVAERVGASQPRTRPRVGVDIYKSSASHRRASPAFSHPGT